ncbi:MAG: UDP-N-acetylmuramoyl-tripeptide--D-alanyl-D-alanine ligase [Alphaproteobacteria bacterium]|nr:UDP-N-acetylmuramoyl-tripeptide--D-alanyl-D-alanine ligase [Alphaproteobacteria bacterium]
MIKLSSYKILEILGVSQTVAETEISNVSTDSRQVSKETLFIALKGEKFDGHDFILEVLAKGVPLVVAERHIEGADEKRVIVVEDSLKAFGLLGQYNRRQYKGTVIALTGSSGKTTTKEELKAALSQYAPTYATSGNFNNFIGVPRSLLDIDMNSKYAIIEMGMSAPKEIDYLVHLTEPDVALVTNVYPMHIEFLKTTENIAKAKAEIFSGLKKGGIAVYNEDALHAEILKAAAEKVTNKIYGFGKNHHAEVKLNLSEEGEHFYYNAWAVLAVISALGLDLAPAVEAVNHFTAPEGRGKRYNVSLGGRKITLIDNSYSGGPDATVLAVESLGKMNVTGRKIAVIGKMAELGDYTKEAHVRVGKALAENHINVVIGVCEETKDVLAQLPSSVEQHYFENIEGVSAFLQDKVLQNGDAVLIKGSHYSSQVYKAAAELKSHAV